MHDGEQFEINTEAETLTSDRLLVSAGSHANTAGLNLDKVGINTGKKDAITVNELIEIVCSNV